MASDKNELINQTGNTQNPLFSEVGILALVPDPWNDIWRSRHQILSRLSEYFYVVWSNPPAKYSYLTLIKGCLRKLFLIKSQKKAPHSHETPPPNLIVYHPESWLPDFFETPRYRLLRNWTMRRRLKRARQLLLSKGCTKVILLICRPTFLPALDLVEHDLSVYRMDDEYTFSPIEQPIDIREKIILSRVNHVFITSPKLYSKKGHLNHSKTLVPNGVDFDTFNSPYPEPVDLKAIPCPRIGYVGVIKEQLDFELLHTLARSHPEWSFVLVGIQTSMGDEKSAKAYEALIQYPNAHILGGKEPKNIAAYMQHMNVLLLCYKSNDYTSFIYPLKLHEYLATGLPIVGKPLQSLRKFSHLVTFAQTPDEWSNAIKKSLRGDFSLAKQKEMRMETARRHDWKHITRRTAEVICEQLGPRYQRQLESLSRNSGTHPAAQLSFRE